MKGKSRIECMVKRSLVILHVFQGCLEFIYLNARAQGKKFILRHIIVYSRNESKNIVTLAPWLQFKTWYNAYIAQVYCKEIKSVPRGLLEHTLCKCRCSVFQIRCFGVFFFLIFFLFQTIRANPINLAKRRHVFFMVQMLLQFMHSLRFYPQQLWNPVKLDTCGKREHLNFFIVFVYGQFHHHGRYSQTQFYTFKLLLIFTYLQYMCLQTLVGWTGNFVSQFDLFDKEKINIKRYVTDVT